MDRKGKQHGCLIVILTVCILYSACILCGIWLADVTHAIH